MLTPESPEQNCAQILCSRVSQRTLQVTKGLYEREYLLERFFLLRER
jgi:hypothetical protein